MNDTTTTTNTEATVKVVFVRTAWFAGYVTEGPCEACGAGWGYTPPPARGGAAPGVPAPAQRHPRGGAGRIPQADRNRHQLAGVRSRQRLRPVGPVAYRPRLRDGRTGCSLEEQAHDPHPHLLGVPTVDGAEEAQQRLHATDEAANQEHLRKNMDAYLRENPLRVNEVGAPAKGFYCGSVYHHSSWAHEQDCNNPSCPS